MAGKLGVSRLLWQHSTAGVGPSVTVAVVVAVMAALAVGVPRATQLLTTDSVRHEVGALAVTARDLSADVFGGPVVGPSADPGASPFSAEVDAVWGNFEDGLGAVRSDLPAAVERSVGVGQYAVTLVPNRAVAAWDGAPDTEIALGFDPRMLDHAAIVEGAPPAPMTDTLPSTEPAEIMLSDVIAARMEWAVGEVRELRTPDGIQPLKLSGIFHATDDGDPYWQHLPATLNPSIEVIGLAPPVVIGVGFAHPASWPAVVPFSAGARMHVWFPVRSDTLTAADVSAFTAGVREFTRVEHTVGEVATEEEWFGRYTMRPVTELPFSSGVTNALDDAIDTTSATSAVLAMTASGPLGVVLAVLLLGTRLIIDRRTPGLQLAAARGASPTQLRTVLAMEGLAWGVPAATVGALVAAILVPGTLNWPDLLLTALVGLLPALLLAFAPADLSMRRVRSDLGPRAVTPWRWVTEVIVVAAAAVSVFLLLRRGLSSRSGAVVVDPLLAAVPLLLALAACVVVMRLYPLPLGAIVRASGGGRGLVAFLGAARSLRDPAAGLAPVLAMVVGVSVAIFTAVMLSTVNAGVDRSAETAVGADLLVSAQAITAEQADAIAHVPGVDSIAPVYAEVRVSLTHEGERDYLTVVVVDAAELQAVQRGVPGAIENLDRLTVAADRVPVIASSTVVDLLGGAADAEIDGEPIAVVGTAPSEGPLSSRRAWVIADRAFAKQLVGTIYSPSRIFVDLDPDAAPSSVRDDIRSIVQASASVSIPTDVAHRLRANPAVSGLEGALIAALLVVSFLCSVAVVLTLARGGAARDRLLAMLRTLGLNRRSAGAVVAWELAPIATVALVVGTALGLTLPAVVMAGVDLTLFTGGSHQPAITVDPFLTALVAGGFVILVLLATAVTAAAARRTDPASALRMIEE